MTELVLNKWYKHTGSPAYAKAVKIVGKRVEMHFDNGFKGKFPVADFSEHFTTNSKCTKLNEREDK